MSTTTALFAAPAFAAPVTNVSTPSGAAHGGLVDGNIPCAIAANEIGDCGKPAPAGAIVGTSDSQTLSNKTISGTQNTMTNVPAGNLTGIVPSANGGAGTITGALRSNGSGLVSEAASSDLSDAANIDQLNGAQTFSALKTFGAGLALPSGSSCPAGSSLYIDTSSNLHFCSSFIDSPLVGGKFSGDATRPWFLSAMGSGLALTSSGQQPNWVYDRNEFYNGGSGLTFNTEDTTNQGKGFNVKTTGDFPNGSTGLTVTANSNIAAGMNAFGNCVQAGTMVSSYSSGNVVIAPGLNCDLPNGSTITFQGTTAVSPGNGHNVGQYTLNSYTTGSTGAGVALGAYAFGYATGSSQILFGSNILARDLSGRKSSVSRSGLLAAEFDVVASGPDDGKNRIGQDHVFAENGPSADGATSFLADTRCRPTGANAQVTPNPIEIIACYTGVTMQVQPSGATGQYGKIDRLTSAESCAVDCYDITGGSFSVTTSASASSGQPNLDFPLGTNINTGQVVSGNASIPAGTTVSTTYQCWVTQPLAGCGGKTNEELVVLSANLTGTVASGASITFAAVVPDGALWSANFSDAFFNLTNTNGSGAVKYGTTNNTGTILDIQGFGEDSTSMPGVAYGDILFKEITNTHGAQVGEIDITPVGGGNVRFPDNTTVGSGGFLFSAGVNMQNHSISSVLNETSSSSTGFALASGACNSATAVMFEPNRSGATGGLGCHNVASDWNLVGAGTEDMWGSASGVTFDSGTTDTFPDSGTWGSGGINGSIIGGTTPAAGTFTTATHTGHLVSNQTALSCGTNVTFGAGAGTSPICNSITGDDTRFNISFTTGTSPSASSTIFTVVFVSSYGSAPVCVFSAVGGTTGTGISKFVIASATANVSMSANSSALTASTAYNLNVACI